MKGRSWQSEKYRYGFNGKENDSDWDVQDYGFRIYKPELGKFLSVDPLTKDYPMLTPYQFASNTPIQAIDLDGLEAFFIHGTWADPTYFNNKPKLQEAFAKTFNMDKNAIHNLDWQETQGSQKNDAHNQNKYRKQQGRKIADGIISQMDLLKNDRIAILTHSHGGNVAIEAVNILVNEYKINPQAIALVTLNLPVRDEDDSKENYENSYRLKGDATKIRFIQISEDDYDLVKFFGGTDSQYKSFLSDMSLFNSNDAIDFSARLGFGHGTHSQADVHLTYEDKLTPSDSFWDYVGNHNGHWSKNAFGEDGWLNSLKKYLRNNPLNNMWGITKPKPPVKPHHTVR